MICTEGQNMIPLPQKQYRVIYADPPWAYHQGGRGAAKNHYHTMTTEDICNMPVKSLHDVGGGYCLLHVGHISQHYRSHPRHGGVGLRVQNGRIRVGQKDPQRVEFLGHGRIHPRERGGMPPGCNGGVQGQ